MNRLSLCEINSGEFGEAKSSHGGAKTPDEASLVRAGVTNNLPLALMKKA